MAGQLVVSTHELQFFERSLRKAPRSRSHIGALYFAIERYHKRNEARLNDVALTETLLLEGVAMTKLAFCQGMNYSASLLQEALDVFKRIERISWNRQAEIRDLAQLHKVRQFSVAEAGVICVWLRAHSVTPSESFDFSQLPRHERASIESALIHRYPIRSRFSGEALSPINVS